MREKNMKRKNLMKMIAISGLCFFCSACNKTNADFDSKSHAELNEAVITLEEAAKKNE